MATESCVKIWVTASDWVQFEYAQARVEYAEFGERIRDRYGLVHWVRPEVARYPVELVLSLLPEELLEMNSSTGAPRSAVEWLEYHFRAQTELLVYVLGESLAVGGEPVARHGAYRCRIREVPAELCGTLPALGDYPASLDVRLAVHEDGTFGGLADFNGYTAYTPARP